jgi:hypothetical protein
VTGREGTTLTCISPFFVCMFTCSTLTSFGHLLYTDLFRHSIARLAIDHVSLPNEKTGEEEVTWREVTWREGTASLPLSLSRFTCSTRTSFGTVTWALSSSSSTCPEKKGGHKRKTGDGKNTTKTLTGTKDLCGCNRCYRRSRG